MFALTGIAQFGYITIEFSNLFPRVSQMRDPGNEVESSVRSCRDYTQQSLVIPRSHLLRSIVFGWILISRNWSIYFTHRVGNILECASLNRRKGEITVLAVCDWVITCDNLKYQYDEYCIFSTEAILKHKQVASMRRKMLFTIFKYAN